MLRESTTMRSATLSGIVIACFISTSATAADYKVGSIEITAPWSRATPKGAATAIGYMTIKNYGTTPDRIVGGSAEFANVFELHSMTMENGISKMRGLKGVDIEPGHQSSSNRAAHISCLSASSIR
jgi:periplasmic copper chaperone A